jgi:DNA-binding NarL/FixJ family response regulator
MNSKNRTRPLPRIRTLLVDDSTVFLTSLRRYVESLEKFEIVGQASDGRQALELARQLEPELVLMDLEMPVLNGLGATESLREMLPETRIVIVSVYAGPMWETLSQGAGAHGFVPKHALDSTLPALLHRLFPGLPGED